MLCLLYSPAILSAVIIIATCQTFQYSRGWTNGKRDNSGIGFNAPDNFDTNNIITGINNNDATLQCNLHKMKVFFQGDHPQQVYLCRLLEILSKINREDKLTSHYRHPYSIESRDIDN